MSDAKNVDSPTPPLPKKRKRRWLKVLVGVLIGLFLLVLLTPTLVSTGVGTRMLLGKVNATIAGNISLDSLSLGWFSGVKVRNFTLKDPDGKIIAHADQADTGLTVLHLLTSSAIDLGNTIVRGCTADLVTHDDGTTNLARALAAKGAPPAPAKPAQPAPASPAPTASAAPAKGTIVRGNLDIDVTSISASAPNTPPLQLANTHIKGTLDTAGPLALTLETTAQNPDKSNAKIAIKANGNFFANGNLKPLSQLQGTGQIVVESFDAAALTPLLKFAGVDLKVTGQINGNIQLTDGGAGGAGKQTLAATWEIKNPTATGPMLQGDTLSFKQISLALTSTLTGEALDDVKLNLASDLGSAGVTGSIRMGDVGGNKSLPPVSIIAGLNVTEFKRQLPHLLADVPDMMVNAQLAGALDLAKKSMTFSDNSEVKEADPKTGLGDSIAIAKGSVLSWGDTPNNLSAQLTYTLERIQGILAKKLPEGTTLAGTHATQIHLTGPLTHDAGLHALSKLSFDKLTFGEDHVHIQGIDLTKGELALEMKDGVLTILPTVIPAGNGGSLNPHGRIDFTTTPPTYISDKQATPVSLVQNVPLNHEIASTWLSALPLNWGGTKGQVTQISGQLNVQLDGASIPLDADAFKKIGKAAGVIQINNLTTEAPFFSQLFQALGPIAKITQPDFLAIKNGSIAPVTFSFADGKITYQNLTLGTDKISMRFSGSVGLDMSLAMTMDLSISSKMLGGGGSGGGGKLGGVANLLGGIAGGNKGAAGATGAAANNGNLDIAIPVALKGTITKPEITISQDALNKSIQNVAPNLIEDLLKKNVKP